MREQIARNVIKENGEYTKIEIWTHSGWRVELERHQTIKDAKCSIKNPTKGR